MDRTRRSETRRWSISFGASIACHLLLALLVVWQATKTPLPHAKQPKMMDVTLLNPKVQEQKKPPKNPDAVSNRNAAGANRSAHDHTTRVAKSPYAGQQPHKPSPPAPQKPSAPEAAVTPESEPRTRMLARKGGSTPEPKQTKEPKPKPHKKPVKKKPPVPLQNLMPSSMALAELSRNFKRERHMKSMLSREADIPINTRKVKYAPYAHELVRALEEQWQPGDTDYSRYSEEARQALMRVTINSNGDLANVEVLRPSPIPQINDSAVEAIHAAAPFHPLPSSWGLDRVSFYLTFEVVDNRFVFHAR
ncbi:MAG TPA: TonB family protein [Mariprofundaceae bacterium]|nr:TonB family protein [Mariprofundaceae bacterium]